MDAFALQVPLRQNPARPAAAGTAPQPRAGVAVTSAAAIARGDRAAIERFYNASFTVALAVARHATGRDEAFCLDVVHDAMIRLLRGVKPTLSDEQLDVYMKRCVVTAALDRLRCERRRTRRERSLDAPAREAGHEPDALQSLRDALAQLDELDRSLLASRFAYEATLEDAGRTHGMSGAAAHGRIRRSLARLGSILKEDDR